MNARPFAAPGETPRAKGNRICKLFCFTLLSFFSSGKKGKTWRACSFDSIRRAGARERTGFNIL